jgi:Protein of unknown function (DUF3224)
MATNAKGSFEVRSWDEEIYDDIGRGAKLTRASVRQSFYGDIEGEGNVEFLMTYQPEGTACFIGVQRVVGTVGGRAGSFVLEVKGTFTNGMAEASWFVIPDSATGELEGLRGSGGFPPCKDRVVPVTLEYEFV